MTTETSLSFEGSRSSYWMYLGSISFVLLEFCWFFFCHRNNIAMAIEKISMTVLHTRWHICIFGWKLCRDIRLWGVLFFLHSSKPLQFSNPLFLILSNSLFYSNSIQLLVDLLDSSFISSFICQFLLHSNLVNFSVASNFLKLDTLLLITSTWSRDGYKNRFIM